MPRVAKSQPKGSTAASEGEKTHRSVDLLGRVHGISSPASPAPRARTAASFTPRPASCAASSRCSPPTKAASTTPPAAPAARSCSRKNSSNPRWHRNARQRKAYQQSLTAGVTRNETPPRRHLYIRPGEQRHPRRLAFMNLAIRSIEADIGKEHADTFRNVQHPDLRDQLRPRQPALQRLQLVPQGRRRALAVRRPAQGNANFACVQHFIHHLALGGSRHCRSHRRSAGEAIATARPFHRQDVPESANGALSLCLTPYLNRHSRNSGNTRVMPSASPLSI
jgi:type I restriction enzyme M protein